MKKVFYIVLLAVVLLVTGYFVKSQNKPAPASDVVEDITTAGNDADSQANSAPEDDNVIMINNDSEADADAAANRVEDNIVEENPDQTSGEGETVIQENAAPAAKPQAPAVTQPQNGAAAPQAPQPQAPNGTAPKNTSEPAAAPAGK